MNYQSALAEVEFSRLNSATDEYDNYVVTTIETNTEIRATTMQVGDWMKVYNVNISTRGNWCDCPDYTNRQKSCKHIAMVLLKLQSKDSNNHYVEPV